MVHALLKGACTSQRKVAPKTDKGAGESNAFKMLRESSEICHFEKDKSSIEYDIHDTKPKPEANRMLNWKRQTSMNYASMVFEFNSDSPAKLLSTFDQY